MNELQYLKGRYDELLDAERISIDPNREWLKKIDKESGVYIIEINGKVAYVGETGNLYRRMRDLLSTYNHTFRSTLGKREFINHEDYTKASSRKKYAESIEKALDEYMYLNCKVSFLKTQLGRKELEEMIENELRDQLLNIRGKRK